MAALAIADSPHFDHYDVKDRSGLRPFFCDGDSTLALRAIRKHRLLGNRGAWFAEIEQALLDNGRTRAFLALFGHAIPESYQQSFKRARQLLAWMAGPVQNMLSPGMHDAYHAGAEPALADLLSEIGKAPALRVRQRLTVPIVVLWTGKGIIVPMKVELVCAPEGAVGVGLSHFPSCRVGFVPFDDSWLDAFSVAMIEGRSIAAQAAGRPPHEVGWGLAVRWQLELDRLWPELADASGTVDSVAQCSLAGPSASSAFGLAVARLLAQDEDWVPGMDGGGSEALALCELRALPLEECLVTAEARVNGVLVGVGGLDPSGGGLPSKLEAVPRYVQGNRLAAIGLARGDAMGFDHVGDVSIERAGSLRNLARVLCDKVFPSRYGIGLKLPSTLQQQEPLPAQRAVLDAIEPKLLNEGSNEGSCTVVEARRGWGKTSLAIAWVRSSCEARRRADALPRLAGWAFASKDSGSPWNGLEDVLKGLEQSARLNLCLARSKVPADLRSLVTQLLDDCSSATRKGDHKHVVLLLDGASDFAEQLRALLPDRMPDGVHVVLMSRPVGMARTGWQVLPLDAADGDESTSIFWVSAVPEGWLVPSRVLSVEMTGVGRGTRLEFAPGEYCVARWNSGWLEKIRQFEEDIADLDERLPFVVTHWPGGQDTSRIESVLRSKAQRTRQTVVLLCERPPAVAASLCSHVLEGAFEPHPVQLATLPGLDRRAYALLVETSDPDLVLRGLAGAEACVPPGEPRRWWLNLGGIDAPPERLYEAAAASADQRWVARFTHARPLGCLVQGAGAAVDVARFACALAQHAVVVVSPYADWLDHVSAQLSRCGRGHLRAQVGSAAHASETGLFEADPEDEFEAFLSEAARCSPAISSHLRGCKSIAAWHARRCRSERSTARKLIAFNIDLAAAARALMPEFPQAVAELIDLVSAHAPAFLANLAGVASSTALLRSRFIEHLARIPSAFGDAAASAALHAGLQRPLPKFAAELHLRLALAWLRDGRKDDDLFEELLAGTSRARRVQLEAICAANGVLASTLDSVRLAARAGQKGEIAIKRMLASRIAAAGGLEPQPQPRDSVFWASAWCSEPGNPFVRKAMADPGLRHALGLGASSGRLTRDQVNDARLGIPAPWLE